MQLYHPNQSNTGSAAGFSVNSKDAKVWVSFVKQTGPKAFKGGKQFNISLGEAEIAAIIYAIENNTDWSTFHKSTKGDTGIKFARYLNARENNKFAGYTLSAIPQNQSGDKFGIVFYADKGELTLFKKYLEFSLEKIFTAEYAEKKKAFKESQNAVEAVAEEVVEEVTQPEEF